MIIANVLILQALGMTIFSLEITVYIAILAQFLFFALYLYLKQQEKNHKITNILLYNTGYNDIALYNKKGKIIGLRGTFFNNKNPLEMIENRIKKNDFNDSLAISKIQTALLSNSNISVDVTLDDYDGGMIFTKISLTFLGKSKEYLLWKMQDITSERAISEVFRNELKYLSEFMDNIPIGLYLADASGKIKFVNNTFCEWIGKNYKEIEGKKISDFTENSQIPNFDGAWQGTLNFKSSFGSFPAVVRHSGYDKGGETMFRSVVIKDVEQGDRAVKLLKEAEIRFQWIFEEAPVGIAFVDNEYMLSDGNDALFSLLKSNREKIIGTCLQDYIIPEDIQKLNQARSVILTGLERAANVELRITNKLGQFIGTASVFLTAMTGLDYSQNTHDDGLVLHFIDTTERNQLAEQFSQAQKMQAMGLMAGGIAHNFNNTLTAIIGFCDLLLQKIGRNDPSYQDIERIKENADRSAELIKDLLSYSRNQPSKVKHINLTTFLADIYNFIRVSIPENIDIKLEHSRHIGAILFDEVKLQQIINNLINNARDAITPHNGSIVIRTKSEKLKQPLTIENDVLPPGKYVVIEIEDDGCGITPEVMPKIFDPFFSTKKDSSLSGSGFGLSIALGDIRQAGGFISVESTVAIGTKFIIYLPEVESEKITINNNEIANDEANSSPLSVKMRIENDGQMAFSQITEANQAKTVIDTSGNARILFVEDEEAVRAFGVRALRNKGYVVVECACAEEAIDIIEQGETFDLLASDVVMPGMSGTELASEVKNIMPDIKVLLMSGYFADIANVDNYNNHFLSKPFSLEQLTTKVKDVIKE